jgi:uncharacterized protein (DUF488 family)
MEIYTIGFTQKSAAQFFELLRRRGIKRLIDVRANNKSQLAGFTKSEDLKYFLRELCQAEYLHLPELAPSPELLAGYRRKQVPWPEYEKIFNGLLAERRVETTVRRELFLLPAVLLCSEPKPDRCHRRLAAEYLVRQWGEGLIIHL